MKKFINKILWWSAGVDYKILEQLPSEQDKYKSLGLTMIVSFVMAMLSSNVVLGFILKPNVALIFSFVWGLLNFNINRFSSISILGNRSSSKRLLLILRIILGIVIAITISYPIQLLLLKENTIQGADIIEKFHSLSKLKAENLWLNISSYLLTLIFIIIEVIPVITVASSDNDPYLKAVENQLTESFARINSPDHELQIVNRQFNNDKTELEGFEMYIDYKSLMVTDINELFSSINRLYNMVYAIETFRSEELSKHISSINDYLKSHPEDILLLHSIKTGNSITFKVKTGWAPKFDIEDGDFVIHVPKGSITLIMLTFLIKGVVDYSISKQKELLEIDKLKLEQTILKGQVKELVSKFATKVSYAPDSVRENLDKELAKFYSLTVGNSNYRKIIITPDTLLNSKIDSGKFLVDVKNDN